MKTTCTLKDLKHRMNQVRVVGSTCLGMNHPLLANKKFDVCIMDEAGQTTIPVCDFSFSMVLQYLEMVIVYKLLEVNPSNSLRFSLIFIYIYRYPWGL